MSCPGCGASGLELSGGQDARTTIRMPRVEGLRRAKSHARPQPPDEDPPGPLGRHSDKTQVMGAPDAEPRMTRVEARAAAKAAAESKGARGSHAVGGHAADAEDDAPDRRRARADRRSERRRGFGLMLTGGFAGIAVAGFLLFGTAGGGGSTPTGSTAAATSSAGGAALTVTISATAGRSVGATSIIHLPVASISKSPSASASASATKSATASAAKTSSAAASASGSASATPSATKSATPSPSASPSNTQTWCFLFC